MPVDHYENFPVASLLVPRRLRRPIEAIYRFARSADDIADEGEADDAQRLRALAAYRDELRRIAQGDAPRTPHFHELAEVIAAWRLPLQPFEDLLAAFAQDVVRKRYVDYDDLLHYCRHSANPVGRLVLLLVDRGSAENMQHADCICTALQLTNFWQDIAIDWQKGRVYLPQSDLARFGVAEEAIGAAACGPQWQALLDFQVERAEKLLREGAPLVRQLPGRIGYEIRLTVQGGLRILERIRQVRGDVFRHRPQLGPLDWLRVGMRAARM